jgi:hypothetical protein
MKKAVRENIEFITDRKILNNGIDSREYQYSLVNVILTPTTNNIVNHFNLSTIKKRIIMMNAKRSSTVHISRYVFMIPAVVALLLVFTVTKAELTIVTKNSVHMFKALKKDVLNLNLNVGKKTTEPETPKPDLHEVSTPVIRRDTLHLAALLTIADTDKKAKPELPLYIDGVKTSRAALAQVDPEKIAKMIVYRDPKAKTDDPEKNGYISIITKGNEESDVVKAFNDKMRKQYGVTVYNTMSNFVWREGKPLGVTNVKIDGRKLDEVVIAKPRTDVVKINGVIVSPATVVNLETVKPNDLTVVGGKITKVRINGDSVRVLPGATNLKYMIQNDSLYGIKKVLVDGHVTIVSQKNRDSLVRAMSGLILNDDGKATRTPLTVVGVNKIYAAPRYGLSLAPSPISFKDKLIIIDGSEATQKEMKKLSADKIQSIDKLDRAEAEKKYGDKGKNGAILITTKSK